MPENNNKDPIEHLFRKKAEEYDISYQEADWMKLEERLDEQQRQLAARRKRWLIAAALLFLFSLLGYAVFQNYQEINKLNEQLDNPSIAETPRDDNATDSSGDRDSNTSAEERSEQPSETLDQPVTEEEPPPFASEREQTQSSKVEEQSVSQTFLVSEAIVQQLEVEDLPQTAGGISEFTVNQQQAGLNLVQADNSYPHFMAAQEEPTDTAGLSEDLARQRLVTGSRVAVGFLAGPDLSTVGGLSDFDQPGYNLGLLVEYRLTSNLSIRSGLMRASVNYKAGGDEYHPPSGFWSYDNTPYQTTAQCIILDIPISLKYDFWHFERSKLYATAGFNSYIMLNEEYQFDYESYNNNQMQEWSDRTGTRHWLSNANLSIGYAFDLNPRMSIQIEPFLKLPMREIGWGNVKLYSVGASVSFNYSLY